ncbi:hypothetical protein [Bradyrhizobium sp.]|uniref:hypothetical protein n=1 Tax=Bradyrhizobium sp. TaxID=376 RepID=UPI002DFC12D8|nr:hypothetical protein [Bradyrhizobium sp.]
MLPGFRFLLGAIVLAISMLIFGLGAAALLRAAHQEFASIPSRRGPPETIFARQSDAKPTLAMLAVEPPALDQAAAKLATSDYAQDQAGIGAAPAEPEKPASGPDQIAALTDLATPAESSSHSETPTPEIAATETPVPAEAPAETEAPSPPVETTVAAVAEMTPTEPNPAPVTTPEHATAPLEDSIGIAQTRIATLGGPPVTIETPAPSKLAPAVRKKSAQTKRATKRRRIAQRARTAPPAPQQPANPFGS